MIPYVKLHGFSSKLGTSNCDSCLFVFSYYIREISSTLPWKYVMADAYFVAYSSLFVNVHSPLACVFESTLNDLKKNRYPRIDILCW